MSGPVGPSSPGTSIADAAAVLERCDALAALTDTPGILRRTHLTSQHAAANAVMRDWMTEAGLAVRQDAAGNLIGRVGPDGAPALVLGSHLDTVTDAGRYDGMLGVLVAVAVAGRLRDADLPFALEVVAFSDEEGTRFGNALAGSRAFAGDWDAAWLDLLDADGVSFRAAAHAFGLDPDRIGEAARRPDELVGYLECHIEQGPALEDADLALGVVTSIAAARRFTAVVTGRAGHAGGTPYDRRRDALVGASELVVEIERLGRERDVVATVGRLTAFPGGVNVIPGRVELSLDLRAETDADRDSAVEAVMAAAEHIVAARGLGIAWTEIYRADAVACDPALREAVATGVRGTGQVEVPALWSRAGHDGMAVADVTGIGMLFVRCAGGVSHSPEEAVRADDVQAAVDAFEGAVLAVAAGRS